MGSLIAQARERLWWHLIGLIGFGGDRPRVIQFQVWAYDKWTDAWYETPEGQDEIRRHGRIGQ